MPKFFINGVWYEADTYLKARELALGKSGTAPAAAKPASQPAVAPAQKGPAPQMTVVQKPPSPTLPPKADTSKPGPMSFDLLCYRGEKNNWWSPPEERLICGMTLYEPWNLKVGIRSMTDLWEHLRKFIQENCFGKVDGFAQYLRATGRPFALATARTTAGSFTSDFNYTIKVANARTFLWGPKLTLGAQVAFAKTSDVTADYIVLNADTIAESTILAFGHKCGTYEVTFLHDLGLRHIESVNNRPVKDLAIMNQHGLSLENKVKLRKYLRHGTSWLG